MMKKCLSILKLLFFSVILNAQNPEAPSWIDYTTKRANGDLKNSVLLDYSYAGYHFSEKELPDVSSWNTISVLDYDVTPNDDIYDDAGIQAAINAAEALNVPTVVYFPAGRYIVSSNATQSIPIRVSRSHIVLKGAGSHAGGTEIYADVVGDVSARWNTIYKVLFKPNNTGSPSLTDIENRINRGDTKIVVKDASKLSVGMVIALNQNEGIENVAINMAGLAIKPEWTDIIRTGMRINEKHIITAINGNEVVFKNPVNCIVTADISRAYLTEYRFIEEVGVEDILFTSGWKNYPEIYVHHANDVVDYGWRGLDMQNVLNGWIQNVEFRDWNESLRIRRSMNVTAKNIKISGKQGHVSYTGYTSSGVLFENCEDVVPVGFNNAGGQGHGLGLQVRSNSCVFLNSKMQQHQSVDFHGYQPYANLVDNLNGGTVRGNGGSERSAPHHGPDLVFWNYQHSSNFSSKEFNFWDLSKRTLHYFPHPKFIGFTSPGESITFKNEGLDELHGQQAYPKSLFDAQLQLRLYDGYMSALSEKPTGLAKYANDDKAETFWESDGAGVGQWLLLDLGIEKHLSAVTINELSLRVNNWKLEYWSDSAWRELQIGQMIGAEKKISFNVIKTRKLRFTVESMLPGKESLPVALSKFKATSEDLHTFKVLTTGETCLDKKNGMVTITADAINNYVATINGTNYNFTASTTIQNLTPGVYDLCIAIEGEEFEQCYIVTIDGGVNLSGKMQVTKQSASVFIDLGTAPYTVFKNGEAIFETYQSNFSVPIKHGDKLEVSSKAACEGILSKSINLLEDVKAYPNPSAGLFEFYIPDSIKTIDLEVYNMQSQLVSKKVFSVNGGKVELNIEDKPSGIYFVKVNIERPVFIKLIKK